MTSRPNPEAWASSPWFGEVASAHIALWNAGMEWAAKVNWFTPPRDAMPSPTPPDRPIERPTDLIVDE
jgi:hypothetical protein